MKSTFGQRELIDSKYRVEFFLDRTSNCELYRVKDESQITRLVALYNSSKVHRHSFFNQDLLEAEILRKLDHRSIISFVDSGVVIKDNTTFHYLVTEFVSGESLSEKMARDGAFSQYTATSIVLRVAKAVGDLHEHSPPIIHNNLNIQNIFLDYSEEQACPVISSFHCARYFNSENQIFDLKLLNPFCTAPEVFNGVYTIQSEIFSLGAMLYHMIFAVPPWFFEYPSDDYFSAGFIDELFEVRDKNLSFILPRGEKFYDESLKNTILKAVHPNIDERFKTLKQFVCALKQPVRVASSESSTLKSVTNKRVVKNGAGFSSIAGMEQLKYTLHQDVIRALNEPELYQRYGLTIPNGMLLYGPPGCGKTFISQKFAEEIGFNFLELRPSDIKSSFINATEENIGRIFTEATENSPTIIFIDEIDAIVPTREESGLHQMHSAPVNELLAQMSNCAEKGIFVIAATNRPERIDPAILRTGRIDKIFYLPPPDCDARLEMFKLYLKDRPVELDFDYEHVAKSTSGYVSSDLKFLVDESSRYALSEKIRITTEHVLNAIDRNKPSVSSAELKKYEILRKKFEDEKGDSTGNPIGFIQ
ncbi:MULTISPECIES: AAA family ATPase [Gammaproteobacteria]|uniref:AAA family ATPase n=1 Tax=Gammaproteobacteria TaxID=1236 RepID=UPI001404263D|nr:MULTISPECIES: AAA family ATPase [Gammaproteobacteria]